MASKKEAKAAKADTKKASSSKASDSENSTSSRFSAVEFLQGTKEELGKVVWPSRQQLLSESFAVILMVTLSASTIYLVDALFGWAARQVF